MHTRTLLYPFITGLGATISYSHGGKLGSVVAALTEDTEFSWIGLSSWEFLLQWGLVLYFIVVGVVGYKKFDLLSDLRLLHRMTYFRLREDVITPGSTFSDALSAYLFALTVIGVPVAVFLTVWIGIPIVATTDFILRIILFFFSAVPAQILVQLTADIIGELFAPKKLKHELEHAGLYMDVILAHREALVSMARSGKDPRDFMEGRKHS